MNYSGPVSDFIKFEDADDYEEALETIEDFKYGLIKQELFEIQEEKPNISKYHLENNFAKEVAVSEESINQNLKNIKHCDTSCKCIICHKLFANRYDLYRHNIAHLQIEVTMPEVFQCDHCKVYITKENNYNRHITSCQRKTYKICISKKMHKCNICSKVLQYNSWKEHVKTVHNKEKFSCSKCDKKYKCIRKLRCHIEIVHDKIKPKYGGKGNLELLPTVKCKQCDKVLKNKYCLSPHIKNCHENSTYICDICQSEFRSKTYLMTHFRRVHCDTGKRYKCKVCEKQFISTRRVKIHMRNSGCIVYLTNY